MNKISRTDSWVARSLIPLAFGVAALGVIVARPFEKHASASEATPTMVEDFPVMVPTAGILLPGTSEVPRHAPRANIARTPATHDVECWQDTPGAICHTQDLIQGAPPGAQVLVCTCH